MGKIEYLICLIPATFSAYTDLTKRTLYNAVTIPMFLAGVIYSLYNHTFIISFLTALSIFIIFFVMAWHGGISGGDVKFATALAMWFGYPGTMYLMLIGSVMAIIFGIINWARLGILKARLVTFVREVFFRLIFRIKTDKFNSLPDNNEISPEGIPFGTFLALGAWVVFILNMNGYIWPI